MFLTTLCGGTLNKPMPIVKMDDVISLSNQRGFTITALNSVPGTLQYLLYNMSLSLSYPYGWHTYRYIMTGTQSKYQVVVN